MKISATVNPQFLKYWITTLIPPVIIPKTDCAICPVPVNLFASIPIRTISAPIDMATIAAGFAFIAALYIHCAAAAAFVALVESNCHP